MTTRRGALRRATLAAGGAIGWAGGAACAPGGPASRGGQGQAGGVQDRPVTLSYLNFFGPADPQNVLFPHALTVFRQRYPQVSVEQVSTSGAGTNVMAKYQALAAAGTPPDVAALNPQFVEPLRARGALADLTPYVRRDARAFQAEDFNEAALLRARRDGKWHAVPLQLGLWFMLYNAALFQQAGVATPDASWTWDRLLEATKAITSRDGNALGMTMPPYELPVRGNGGDVLSQDERRCVLDQPPAVEAIQWNADLRQRHHVVPGPAEQGGLDTRQLFDSGRLAVHIGDPGFLSGTQRGKLGFAWNIAAVPRGKAARVTTVKGPSLVMIQGTKEHEVAWAWLLHYTSPEMQRYVAVEGKILSARMSALRAYVALDEGFDGAVLLDMAAIARPMPYVARYDEMDEAIRTGLDAAYNGEKSAREAMAEVVRRVNDLLAGPA